MCVFEIFNSFNQTFAESMYNNSDKKGFVLLASKLMPFHKWLLLKTWSNILCDEFDIGWTNEDELSRI